MTIDHFYQQQHRRLRTAYKWATVLRHEKQLMLALEKRKKAENKNNPHHPRPGHVRAQPEHGQPVGRCAGGQHHRGGY